MQGLHPQTQAALAATLPQQTVLIQAQAQQTQAALGTTLIAATLAGPSANGGYGNSQQLVILFNIFYNFLIQLRNLV